MSEIFSLDSLVEQEGPVIIKSGKEHSFSTNWTTATEFHLHNSDLEGMIEVWALGKKQGGGKVPPNYDKRDSKNCHGVAVTVKNKGKSTFTITTNH